MATTRTKPCYYELLLLYTELRYCQKFSDIISVVSWSLHYTICILEVVVALEMQTVRARSLDYEEKWNTKYGPERRIIERGEVAGSTGDAKSESQAADILRACYTHSAHIACSTPVPSLPFPPSRFSFTLPPHSFSGILSLSPSLLIPCSVDKKTARKIILCLWRLQRRYWCLCVCLCSGL